MAVIDQVLARLEGVKKSGRGWKARCPAHEDERPSLEVAVGDNGGVLLWCGRGCAFEAISGAIGFKQGDLCNGDERGDLPVRAHQTPARRPALAAATNGAVPAKKGRIVATYDYTDAEGELLYQHVRWDPKNFTFRRPDPAGRDGWTWNLEGVDRVLFHLPKVNQALAEGKPVCVAEGEKDVLTLESFGLCATCNDCGASKNGSNPKWTDEHAEALYGMRVIVFPDKDEAGEAHAQAVALSLDGMGTEVRIVTLPDLPEGKKDVTDWVEAGGTREALMELIKAAPVWEPPPDESEEEEGEEEGSTGGSVIDLLSGKVKAESKLWTRWRDVAKKKGVKLIWAPTTKEAYIHLKTGEVYPLNSDNAARWFQARTDAEAGHRTRKWNEAFHGLRMQAEKTGTKKAVAWHGRVDWANHVAYIGCEDEKHVYRVTPEAISLVPNGTDDVLIFGGSAPVIEEKSILPKGEIARFLIEDTWACPVSRVAMAVLAVMMCVGTQAYRARPLIGAVGHSGSGKTTALKIMGETIFGERMGAEQPTTQAQAMKNKEEENESRIVTEKFAIFDNIDSTLYHYSAEDFLATACDQAQRTIRKMRTEGEVVSKLITAFVGFTSFSMPKTIQRIDVVGREVILFFRQLPGAEVSDQGLRYPVRSSFWCDLLVLFQRVLKNWPTVPKGSAMRSIQFAQVAHAILGHVTANALETTLLGRQGAIAVNRDPILDALVSHPLPDRPMFATELLDYWWPPVPSAKRGGKKVDDGRPANPRAMGNMLARRRGALGEYFISSDTDVSTDSSVWTFVLRPQKNSHAEEGLSPEAAVQAMREHLFYRGNA